MNWDAVAAIGEIIGAGAVLATLGFLAIQIRHGQRLLQESNVLARSAASDKAFDQFSNFRRLLAADSDVTRIWLAGRAKETLDEVDTERFHQLATEFLFAYGMYAQRMEALDLKDVAQRATLTLADQLKTHPGLQPHWPEIAGSLSSATVVAKVSSALSD